MPVAHLLWSGAWAGIAAAAVEPVRSAEAPTACMSFNNHRDHFGAAWSLRLADGGVAHTGCVAFGIDRLTLALFATHGLDLPHWPVAVRKALAI